MAYIVLAADRIRVCLCHSSCADEDLDSADVRSHLSYQRIPNSVHHPGSSINLLGDFNHFRQCLPMHTGR